MTIFEGISIILSILAVIISVFKDIVLEMEWVSIYRGKNLKAISYYDPIIKKELVYQVKR